MTNLRMLLAGAALDLAGCSGVQYAIDNYGDTEMQRFYVVPDDGKPRVIIDAQGRTIDRAVMYRIFDKPAENRLMITPSVGSAAAGGALKGLTFGAVDPSESEVEYRNAAEKFLASTGRTCRAIDIALVVRPQYEVRYECNGTAATARG